jgi:hypothetical protein
MNDPTPSVTVPAPALRAKLRALSAKLTSFSIVRESVAIIFWLYVLLKLFVFDVDRFLIAHINPDYIWVSDYRSLILIAIVAGSLLIVRRRYLLFWFLYIAFYPLILLFVKLSRAVWKRRSWILGFVLLNSAMSIYATFRYKFIFIALFVLSIFLIIKLSNPILLIGLIAILLVLITVTYCRAAIFVTQPSRIFKGYYKVMDKTQTGSFVDNLKDKDTFGLPMEQLSAPQLELR